ncbi:unnamed protein product [Fusarium graminearum]|nr:unnamed protein product [Fusarium graminearum]
MCSVKLYAIESCIRSKDCCLDEAFLDIQNLRDRHGSRGSEQKPGDHPREDAFAESQRNSAWSERLVEETSSTSAEWRLPTGMADLDYCWSSAASRDGCPLLPAGQNATPVDGVIVGNISSLAQVTGINLHIPLMQKSVINVSIYGG